MTEGILGLSLEDAVACLRSAGVEPVEITEVSAPRGSTPRGSLRVVRVRDGGRSIVCARFPDTLEDSTIENT